MSIKTAKVDISIPNKFLKYIKEKGIRIAFTRVNAFAERIIQNIIKREFIKFLKNSPVMVALKGGSSTLIPSLGLTQEMASRAYDKIINKCKLITYKVELKSENIDRTFQVEIKVFIPSFGEYRNLFALDSEPFAYISHAFSNKYQPKDTKIPWLKWLLQKSTDPIDKGGVDWSISYNLTSKQQLRSRSGRAMMVPRGDINFTTPYVLPKIYIPKGKAENFIDEIFKSNAFIAKIKSEINISIRQLIKKPTAKIERVKTKEAKGASAFLKGAALISKVTKEKDFFTEEINKTTDKSSSFIEFIKKK